MEKIQLGGCDGTEQNAERLATSSPESMPQDFYRRIAEILKQARKRAYSAVNYSMVLAYWEIGCSIVKEQGGAERAAYGGQADIRFVEKAYQGFR